MSIILDPVVFIRKDYFLNRSKFLIFLAIKASAEDKKG